MRRTLRHVDRDLDRVYRQYVEYCGLVEFTLARMHYKRMDSLLDERLRLMAAVSLNPG